MARICMAYRAMRAADTFADRYRGAYADNAIWVHHTNGDATAAKKMKYDS